MGGEPEKRGRLRPLARSSAPRVYRPGPFAAIYTTLLVAGVAGAVGVYFLLLAAVPGAKAARLDVAKTALLVIGGSGAVAGLYVAYRKQRTDEANHIRDQDKLFTERYTQAVAQLGSTAAAVRLGGVYALARIADDSERDRSTCLDVLCAYLRMPYDPDADPPAERQVRTTAQAALAARLSPSHPGFWLNAEVDLREAHLINLNFRDIAVHMLWAQGATFAGSARFEQANFQGEALLDGATFTGDVRFDEATFTGTASFEQAAFTGDAWFHGATFTREAWFSEATFIGDAMFGGATFTRDAVFGGATFTEGAGFTGAIFIGGAWFGEASFTSAIFGKATFARDAMFGKATFTRDAVFGKATFTRDAEFDGATFTGDAEFGKATFTEGAGFTGATFTGGAWFDGAIFNPDHRPRWPDGFTEPVGIKWSSSAPTRSTGGD